MVTAGSRGVRTSWQMLLQAGASARERLIAAAAQRWNVPATECEAANSKIVHKRVRPQPRLRRARGGCCQDQARQGAGDPHARPVQADRTIAAAPRHAAQDQRRSQVRHRHANPRHGLCGDRRLSGRRRQAQKRGRDAGQGPARHASKWSSSTTRWRWSPTASGAPRKRWRCSSRNGTRAPPARPTARNSPSSIATRSTGRW